MNAIRGAPAEVVREAAVAVEQAKPWVERAARVGHACKGLVYVLVGTFAIATLVGLRSQADGPGGALVSIRAVPLGRALLFGIATGLAYYALWELVRAAFDPERDGRGKPLRRAGWLVTAVVFGSLAFTAFTVAAGAAAPETDDQVARHGVARIMADVPYGRWLLGVAAVVVIGTGVALIRRGWRADLERRLDLTGLPPAAWYASYVIARFGTMARGVVLVVIGTALLCAALLRDASDAVGMAGALRIIGAQAWGPYVLAAVAVGLVSHGVYELLIAWRGRFALR